MDEGLLGNFGVKYVPPKLFIQRTELIMQLNRAPLITDETVKGPSARPLNPTPTVLNFSTDISQKYNTTSKEVIIIIIKKALKVGMPLHYIISKNMSFTWVDHLHDVFYLPHITRWQLQKDTKNEGRNGEDA